MARTNAGRASLSFFAGERGVNRVRLFAHPTSGVLCLEWYQARPGARPQPQRKSLGHAEWERAKVEAYEMATTLLREGGVVPAKREAALTLGALFDMYVDEVTPTKSWQAHDRRAIAVFTVLWRRDRVVATLSDRDFQRFVRMRRSGELAHQGRTGKPVRDRIIQQDLSFLRAVLNWATRVKDESGQYLLVTNPMRGFKLPAEANPQRPLLTADAYQALLQVAMEIAPRFHLALVLCHETGHRLNSVRSLRWSDVDLAAGKIRWRSEHDKIKYEHETPLSVSASDVLKAARRSAPRIGDGWLFPSRDGSAPIDRGVFYSWWKVARTKAKLTGQRGAFHALRRKFATELMHVPLKTLSSLGGWKETRTIVDCYQRPDETQLREALEQRKPLTSAVSA